MVDTIRLGTVRDQDGHRANHGGRTCGASGGGWSLRSSPRVAMGSLRTILRAWSSAS